MINKELIEKFKDMADCADAAYAMLHYVYDNETFFAKWLLADRISLGYEIKDDQNIQDRKGNIISTRLINEPTAYALAIEARFCQDLLIDIADEEKNTKISKKINNKIQRFIKTNKKESQEILVATTKEEQNKNPNLIHTLSLRTKNFVNRFELVHHIPNTTISGFSATLFYDTENKEYILSFRGTETTESKRRRK